MEYFDTAFGTLEREESILDSSRFRRLVLARALAQTAQNAILYALLIIVVKETGSGVYSSLLLLSIIIPAVVTGLFSGALADRLPKKAVLVVADLLRMAIAVAFFFAAESLWKMYAIATVFAVASELRGPAEAAVVPSLVRYRQLAAANALLNVAYIAGQVLGAAALTPIFLKTAGPAPLYLVAASLFALAALVVAVVPRLEPQRRPHQEEQASAGHGVGKHFKAAWAILRTDPVSYLAVLQLVLVTTAVLTLVTLMSRFMKDVLAVEAENAVFVFAPAAVGLLAGLRLAPKLARGRGNAAVVSLGFLFFVLLMPLLGFVPELGAVLEENTPLGVQPGRVAVAALLAAPLGFAYSLMGVSARAVLHERAPAAMRGRIFAVMGVLVSLASIGPLVVAGAVADLFGIRVVVLLIAATALAVAVYGYLRRPLARQWRAVGER